MAKQQRGEGGRDMVKVSAPVGTPEYLQKYLETDTSLDSMQQYRVVPRLKVVQGTSSEELQANAGIGAIVLTPGNTVVAALSDDKKDRHSIPFNFVPILFFTEFLKFRDLKDKEGGAMIMERTFDPGSELAKKAKDSKKRKEEYGEPYKDKETGQMRRFSAANVEALNFPGFIYSPEHPLKGQIVTLVFQRGEFTVGTNFISSITMRRIPLWSQVYTLFTTFRPKSAEKKWWGIDAKPAEVPTIAGEEVEFFKTTHDELKAQWDKKMLVVDRSDADGEPQTEEGADEAVAAASKDY